ncbi:MAG TPA: hypothetical protein VJN62_16450 [Gemmatimonadales bacterium]|nr:hypothetical protein [Gemmatimonadales bacterium]
MHHRHRALLGFATVVVLAACEDNQPIPTSLTRVRPSLDRDVAFDSTTIPPQGPYVAVDVGTFGGQLAQANAINNDGLVVGKGNDTAGVTHAFLWQNGVLQDLGSLGGTFSEANDVNNEGDIVGTSTTADGVRTVVIWQNGVIRALGALWSTSLLPKMNQSGDVTWTGPTPTGPRAFLWHAGVIQDLGTLGGPTSVAGGINDAGQVFGGSSTGTQSDAFVWTDGAMQDIPSPVPGAAISANAMNNRGWVAGTIRVSGASPWQKAFVWNGQSVSLIPVFGRPDTNGIGSAITERGDVYGFDFNLGGDFLHPFVWTHGTLLPLNPDKTDQHMLAVNDHGVATGWEVVINCCTEHPIVLDHGSSWDLGAFSGARFEASEGLNLNAQGDVVGFSYGADGRNHAALWRRTP